MRGIWGALVLALAMAVPAQSQEPGLKLTALASGEVTLSADADTSIRPAAEIKLEGPLALSDGAPLRVSARFRIFGLPGETVDLLSVETFRAAELSVGAAKRIGKVKVGSQEFWTSVEGEWGFATTLPGETVAADRYPRHYALGFRIEERSLGARLSMLYGRHESAGARQWGQLVVSGEVPLSITADAIVVGGDAVLSVGPPDPAALVAQKDILRLYVAVSLPDLVGLVKK